LQEENRLIKEQAQNEKAAHIYLISEEFGKLEEINIEINLNLREMNSQN
jgi:hypothetical protein